MRQLDLFNSLFDAPEQEKDAAGKPVLSKKQEENVPAAMRPTPSFSKNRLTAERVVETTDPLTNKNAEGLVETEETNSTSSSVSAPNTPLTLSLFDDAFSQDEVKLETKEIQHTVITNQWQTSTAEDGCSEVISAELHESFVPKEMTVSIVEKEPASLLSSSNLSPVAEVKDKIATRKQKKQKAPELKRVGSVIFDDGKITVKIKNKRPFPPSTLEVKKEKPKKETQKRGRKSFKEIDAEVDLIEIPEDEILFQKQYYPISEVAKWFRVNTSLLRFWENEFEVLKPRKNRKGDRLFRPEDVKNLQLIYQLLRQRKYTIEGAKEYIKTNKKKADIQLHLTNTLQKFKTFLLDLKANLQP